MKALLQSKKIIAALIILGGVILMLLSFALGQEVGIKKAMFSCQWGENYQNNFMPPRPEGPMGWGFQDRGLRNGHGVFGTVVSINDNSLIIKGKDNQENTVNVSEQTVILSRTDKIALSDMTADMEIAVVGKPNNQGSIDADLIRIFPERNNAK